MKRYLGIDYGEKRIGIAISDPLNITAQPQQYILNNDIAIESIMSLTKPLNITTLIIGLPKSKIGTDSQKAKEIRQFAKTLTDKENYDIIFQDERYSTVAVERTMIQADVSRKKRKEKVDSLAAAFILQGYLDKKQMEQSNGL